MRIFKASYRIVRKNSDDIYKGFGFKHLSDATQYYVHPDNQSPDGTTTLCQPIGEAIGLFTSMINSLIDGKNPLGNYYVSDEKDEIFLEITVPEDYRTNGVVESEIFSYRALYSNGKITIAAYDERGNWIDSNITELGHLYKLLPAFCVMIASEIETNQDFYQLYESFVNEPTADNFVNIHEDFYQNHKLEEFELEYAVMPEVDTDAYHSFSESFQVIQSNRKERLTLKKYHINFFPKNTFKPEYRDYIPKLGKEFVLPKQLEGICNALVNRDLLAVLLHGPAGTGKTMSCKLIAQAIKMPIMETINCTENLDEFVLGKFIPEDDKIIFKESFVTKAIRDGGAVVFEEINFARPQYLAFLNSLLDDNGFVRLDNGEIVTRHKNFRFFATMNMGYQGTKELNQALFNRFSAVIEIAALSDEAINKMLTERVPECAPFVPKMLSVYRKLKKKVEAEDLDVVISPRNLEHWARLAKYQGYIQAAESTLVPIAKGERTLENSIRGLLMLYKWK